MRNKSFHRNPPEMLPPHSPPRKHSPPAPAQHGDDAVRLTDDDAASSRLYVSRLRAPSTAPDYAACSSAAQAGYLHDPFASLLYKAPMSQPGEFPPQGASRARKPPLINVGTHHRTWGIDLLVDRFLQSGGKQVVSLGAGSDTRFWRLMSRATPPDLAKYVEIDFPHLTSPKAQRIARHRKLSQYLDSPLDPSATTTTAMPPPGQHSYKVSKGGTQLSSPLYTLIPLDLRPSPSEPASSISSILTHHILPQLDPNLPTLFLAECLFPYMSPDDSKEIIKWFGETFHSCIGVVYEMVGLDDSFGNVMRRNLAVSRCSFRVYSLITNPTQVRNLSIPGSIFSTPESQAGRFTSPVLEGGKFDSAGAKTLWQIREEDVGPEELQRISKLEILDEIEELRLVLEHYVIAWGTKGETMSSVSL
ncbi:leucine carboxyl methyltransferase 1 [Cryptococcus neoformans A2-102-5]|nr:leucine carboxyl methyltransferase 1 [Cryptococcus neoformans var. grubii AD1-83a]OXG66062.1 leucine carboxyl methyltransferase 1 [Cryptococcus neoformans var. grubii MW-RSA1955]OXG67716.1 leucine carboxyl methyltransferase 1 [Cryptococcus neoformans var. grubii c8]OXG70799.1 leucine carboxyl methyltransferase 1 [Cryptococcus neoformans var. grubii CHC193]OXG91400.1 leucine carboxyl methyltransferase 1 [Cryptococcus neoformans var. grubii D17-1]OXG98795.1 leucine carboxyl methyltransferase 